MSTAGERSHSARTKQRDESSASIHIRVPQPTKQLIETAASAVGRTLSEFVLDSARKQAIDVLLDRRLFVLDADKYDAFLDALDNPPPADKALMALMRRQPPWEM